MSHTVALVELVASASDSLDERPSKNCFGCPDERTIYTRIWQGIAIASFAVNITAMIIEESIIIFVAGIVACMIAPIVIVLQFQLQDTDSTVFLCVCVCEIICVLCFFYVLPLDQKFDIHIPKLLLLFSSSILLPFLSLSILALRMVQNALRKEVNRLNEENDKLGKEILDLEVQVQRIQTKEQEFDTITKQQGINSQTFLDLVNTNRTTLDELKVLFGVAHFILFFFHRSNIYIYIYCDRSTPTNVFFILSLSLCKKIIKIAAQDDLTQILVTACIDSDMDQSGHYSDPEIQILELRLQSIPGIIVNTTLFQEEIQKLNDHQQQQRPIESILSLIQYLHRTDIPNEQKIFQFDETNVVTTKPYSPP
jgi:hypothetical protein